MIVCQCAVVSDGDVAAAVRAGCRSLREVCAATGAGRDCGSCVFGVRGVISRAARTVPLPLAPEVARATG